MLSLRMTVEEVLETSRYVAAKLPPLMATMKKTKALSLASAALPEALALVSAATAEAEAVVAVVAAVAVTTAQSAVSCPPSEPNPKLTW